MRFAVSLTESMNKERKQSCQCSGVITCRKSRNESNEPSIRADKQSMPALVRSIQSILCTRLGENYMPAVFVACLLLAGNATTARAQGLSPATPAKEYIRSGAIVVAIENRNGSQSAELRVPSTTKDFLTGSPFYPKAGDSVVSQSSFSPDLLTPEDEGYLPKRRLFTFKGRSSPFSFR